MGKAYANRKSKAERSPNDFYPTPKCMIQELVDFQFNGLKWEDNILDPCCGKYAIGNVLRDNNFFRLTERDLVYGDDFLKKDETGNIIIGDEHYDAIVMNPPFSCYSEDTEVFTSNGWKLFKDVTNNDLILSVNLDDGQKLEYVKYTSKIVRELQPNEKMLHFKRRSIDLLVTGDHRMIYKRLKTNDFDRDDNGHVLLKPANKLNKSDYIPMSGYKWIGSNQEKYIIKGCWQTQQYTKKQIFVEDKSVDFGDWVEFLGFWLADGCVRTGVNSRGNPRYTVSIKQRSANEDYVISLYEKLGFSPKIEHSKTGNNNYTVYSKQLWEELKVFGKSYDKFVPDYVLNSSPDNIKRFIKGYFNGDSFISGNTIHFSSVSKELAFGVQQCILRAYGLLCQILEAKSTYKGKPYKIYTCSFCEKTWLDKYMYKSPELVDYKGKVFCLSLERNYTMLVRHNNKVLFSGNCFNDFVEKSKKIADRVYCIGKMNFFGAHDRNVNGLWEHLEWVLPFDRQIAFDKPEHEDGKVEMGMMITGWFIWNNSYEGYPKVKVLDMQKYAYHKDKKKSE